jgi:hypothetical protein
MKKLPETEYPQAQARRYPVPGLELGVSTSIPRCEAHDLEGQKISDPEHSEINYEQTFEVRKRGNCP